MIQPRAFVIARDASRPWLDKMQLVANDIIGKNNFAGGAWIMRGPLGTRIAERSILASAYDPANDLFAALSSSERRALRLLKLHPFNRRDDGGWRFGELTIAKAVAASLVAAGRAEIVDEQLIRTERP
jgi:hypothetical protein